MQAINISYLADVDSGIRRYIRYAILVGRNIEIVLERSRQGLLRLETIAFRQVQDWLIALLELLRNLRQLAAADVLAEGMAGLFLKHTLQVPLRVTGALRHFFQRQGDSEVILDPRQKILWIVMASLLRLDIILPLLILRQDLLEQLLKHGDFVRRQIFR